MKLHLVQKAHQNLEDQHRLTWKLGKNDMFDIILLLFTKSSRQSSLPCQKSGPLHYISALLACRLVPLKKKDNGNRPVGVGECLR